MTARWQKNTAVAAQRTCRLLVFEGGVPCDPSKDFIALGYLFVLGANSPTMDLATGTCTNNRRALVIADTVFTADNTTETFAATAHGMKTGDGPIRVANSGGALPTGLVAATDYYVIEGADANHFQLASSLANAYAGTVVSISTDGTGTQTLSDTASTQRGMRGDFTYVATQVETQHDQAEMLIIIDGPVGSGYERLNQDGGYTTVLMGNESAMWDEVMEDGLTYGDGQRLQTRTIAAKFSKSGSDYVYRDLADSKDSHHGTVTSSGRIDAAVDDPS